MPKFFFHLRDGADHTVDPEAVELPDVEAAARQALREARVILANDVQDSGCLKLDYRIDVEDEAGALLYSLPFMDAVHIVCPSQA